MKQLYLRAYMIQKHLQFPFLPHVAFFSLKGSMGHNTKEMITMIDDLLSHDIPMQVSNVKYL